MTSDSLLASRTRLPLRTADVATHTIKCARRLRVKRHQVPTALSVVATDRATPAVVLRRALQAAHHHHRAILERGVPQVPWLHVRLSRPLLREWAGFEDHRVPD